MITREGGKESQRAKESERKEEERESQRPIRHPISQRGRLSGGSGGCQVVTMVIWGRSVLSAPATATYTPEAPGGEQTSLRWGSCGQRKQATQPGGMQPAPGCEHKNWRTYECQTKWWQRCEDCKGRLAEGRVEEQEGQKRLAGWTPPGWTGTPSITVVLDTTTGKWACNLCSSEMAHGAAKVITDVGAICMSCRTGPLPERQLQAQTSEEESAATAPQAPTATLVELSGRSNASTGAAAGRSSVAMSLTAQQVEYLQETLTVAQWERLRGMSP